MDKLRKFKILILSVGMALFITACGKGENNDSEALDDALDIKDVVTETTNEERDGVNITYEIATSNPTEDEINMTLDRLQRRVDQYSAEGVVKLIKGEKISVEIPIDTSAVDIDKLVNELGRPGRLEFLDSENYEKLTAGKEYEFILNGADIKDAKAEVCNTDTGVKQYQVSLAFTDEGTKKFGDATAANIGNIIYIVSDGAVVSAPRVVAAITEGVAVINGLESYEDASTLASTIKIGVLPLELIQVK